jgi:mono/diheme cytochrome c family protein
MRLALPLTLWVAAAGSPAAGAEPPDADARGERAMRRFCLSCHGAPSGGAEDPLGPRLRPEVWGDPDRAYALLGDLQRVNRRMDQPFPGPDDERRALAGWLARRARENRTPPWKAALPWAALLVLLAAAGGLVARRRIAPRRP